MLSQVLTEINNHFVDTHERNLFTIEADGIIGSFSKQYLVGQYVCIDGSKINDDVYKITAVSANKLTLEGTLSPEEVTFDLFGLAIPKALLEIVEAIKVYTSRSSDGLASESQGGRAVSYKQGSGWVDVFKPRLKAYRAIYSDKNQFTRNYDIRTKGY